MSSRCGFIRNEEISFPRDTSSFVRNVKGIARDAKCFARDKPRRR